MYEIRTTTRSYPSQMGVKNTPVCPLHIHVNGGACRLNVRRKCPFPHEGGPPKDCPLHKSPVIVTIELVEREVSDDKL